MSVVDDLILIPRSKILPKAWQNANILFQSSQDAANELSQEDSRKKPTKVPHKSSGQYEIWHEDIPPPHFKIFFLSLLSF